MIVFETPGLIDIRAFTLMGVSAKPNSTNPIGIFGTGIKYSVATLVRLGGKLTVWIGQDKYTFFKRASTFRDTDLEMVWMRREKFSLTKARNIELPYATNYGRNWKPWMVFRELESNTLDENGKTYMTDWTLEGEPGKTRIVVDLPEFTDAYHKRDEIFLPDAQRAGTGIQVVEQRTKHLYWRGLKVYEVNKPCLATYNFLDRLELTEDRTLAAEFWARYELAKWIVRCDDEVAIKRVITAGDDSWESGLSFDQSVEPSETFHRVMQANQKRARASAVGYYSKWDSRPLPYHFDPFQKHPLPWKVIGTAVYDSNDGRVFDAPYDYGNKWEPVAEAILRRVNPTPDEEMV